MLLVIDNYDSFTFNLVQYLGKLLGGGQALPIEVQRNDQLSVEDALALHPAAIVISPGPGRPEDAGICLELIRRAVPDIPVLGICLGHQCLAQALGGSVVPSPQLFHGKVSAIFHNSDVLFAGIESPFTATRYHSLRVADELPASLRRIAWTAEGELMGIAHTSGRAYGLQFHPESILTECGQRILSNFLSIAGISGIEPLEGGHLDVV